VTDATGCSSSDSVSVTMIPRPSVAIAVDTTRPDTVYACRDEGRLLIAEIDGENPPYDIVWSEEAGLNRTDSSHVTALPSDATVYVVEVTDAATGCGSRDTIVVIPVDPPTVDAGEDARICTGESVLLGSASNDEGLLYAWSPSPGLVGSPSDARPDASPDTTTTYYLQVTDGATGCTSIDSVRVSVSDVDVRAGRSELDFGLLEGCRSDSTILVELINDGESEATIEDWQSDLPDVSVQVVDATIEADGRTEIAVRFAPGAAGAYSGTIDILIGPCDDTVTVSVTGEKERSTVNVRPGTIDYGVSFACEVSPRDTTVTIANVGTGSMELRSASVGGPWSVQSPTLPVTVDAGDSVRLTLRYAPTGAGDYADAVRIPYASGSCNDTLEIGLHGSVDSLGLDGPSSVSFGLLDGCVTDRDTTITVTNPRRLPIEITSVDLPPGVTLSGGLPMRIAPGESVMLEVRYAPSSTGTLSGEARFTLSPCDAELAVDLSGEKRGVTFRMPDTIDVGVVYDCGP